MSPESTTPLATIEGLERRHGREQCMGVWVPMLLEDLVGRHDLDDLAEVHDRDPISHVVDDAEVVRDEEVREPVDRPGAPATRSAPVTARSRRARRRARRARGTAGSTASARAIPTRWRCPRRADVDGGSANAGGGARRGRGALPTRRSRAGRASPGMPLRHDRRDRHARVEGRVRILEDDLHAPAERAELDFRVGAMQVAPIEADDSGGGLERAAGSAAQAWSCPTRTRRRGRGSHRGRIVEEILSTASRRLADAEIRRTRTRKSLVSPSIVEEWCARPLSWMRPSRDSSVGLHQDWNSAAAGASSPSSSRMGGRLAARDRAADSGRGTGKPVEPAGEVGRPAGDYVPGLPAPVPVRDRARIGHCV